MVVIVHVQEINQYERELDLRLELGGVGAVDEFADYSAPHSLEVRTDFFGESDWDTHCPYGEEHLPDSSIEDVLLAQYGLDEDEDEDDLFILDDDDDDAEDEEDDADEETEEED